MPQEVTQEIDTTAAGIVADLEELQSRGFGHPDATMIVGRVKVSLQQLRDLAIAPPPSSDPVDVALQKIGDRLQVMADQVEALHQAATQARP